MAINFDKVYTVKSNAVRDMRKAVAAGEYKASELDVSVVPTGYQIGLTNPPAGARDPEVDAAQTAQADFMTLSTPTGEAPAAKVLERTAEWPFAKAAAISPCTALTVVVPSAASLAAERMAEGFAAAVQQLKAEPTIAEQKAVELEAVTPLAKAAATRARRARTEMAKADQEAGGDAVAARLAAAAERGRAAAKKAAARKTVIKPAREAAAKATMPASAEPRTAGQLRLLLALADCKALAKLPLAERAGVWVRSAAVHDSDTPHNLDMKRVPALMGGLKRAGLVECG